MTHELKHIIEAAWQWRQQGLKTVLASVVSLEGSSYRRPGVRMLWNEMGEAVGAVSGGCVEKEVFRQCQSVLQSGIPKVMTYDGRFRLGCEGILYLLLEPVEINQEFMDAFEMALNHRKSIEASTFFMPAEGILAGMGTHLTLDGKVFTLSRDFKIQSEVELACFQQDFPPLFQVYVFGAEHDAVAMSVAASALGWEVTIVAAPDEAKTIEYFRGASRMISPFYEEIQSEWFDQHTAIILMSHSFNKDVQYALALQNSKPAYFGILGPATRREKVIDKLLEFSPEIDPDFIEAIHGPAGINIGAESPQEIAVSIVAEILSVVRKQEPMSLRDKIGQIHA